MLWTDGLFLTAASLARIDSGLVDTAQAENITLDGPGGAIFAGIEEAASELTKLVLAFGGYLNSGDLTANHYAAVMNVGIGNSVRQKIVLQQVCINAENQYSWSHVVQWAALWCVYSVYRNAFQRNNTDRYKEKMVYYKKELDNRVRWTLSSLGVPVVLQPLSAPAALWGYGDSNSGYDSGTWDSSNLSLVSSPSATFAGSLDVAVTYADMSAPGNYVSYLKQNNCESGPSSKATITVTAGHKLSVNIASLKPADGIQPADQVLVCVVSPRKATHWNVYAGLSGSSLYLQNTTPIPVGTTSYTLTGDPVLSGFKLGRGQFSDRRLSIQLMRQRA